MQNNREFILIGKKNEAENITSLLFNPLDNLEYRFIPGQYVNIKPQPIIGRSKSYTISSIPSEKTICITIKKKGEMSSALIDLPIKTKLTLDGPYGYFYPEKDCGDLVLIAGGIGVTPFYSIIKSKLISNYNSNITLFYSNKTIDRTPFFKELNKMSEDYPFLRIIYCLTEENIKHSLIKEYTRINEEILKKYIVSVDKKCYYVCGSVGFVNDIWKMLKSIGVEEEKIFTESFF